MEHIAALLLIIGCSDDLATCKELPAPVALFETSQECEAELSGAFRPHIGDYPQVFAQCVSVDPALEDENAELVWDVKSDGTLFAQVGDPDVLVAEGRIESGRADRLTSRN